MLKVEWKLVKLVKEVVHFLWSYVQAFKLAENSVKCIVSIKRIEKLKYTLKTENGNYLVEATDLPLPITKINKL